jgi:hypothetical protein
MMLEKNKLLSYSKYETLRNLGARYERHVTEAYTQSNRTSYAELSLIKTASRRLWWADGAIFSSIPSPDVLPAG